MKMNLLQRLKHWARQIKRDVLALWIAARDDRTPWYAKILALVVAAYAISPIDLIPDFIPVIGYLDDVILVPLGILLVVWLIPAFLMDEFRDLAERYPQRPKSFIAAGLILLLWILTALYLLRVYFA